MINALLGFTIKRYIRKELLNTLPHDDKEIYTNKVLNAVSKLNKEILNKGMPEPENDYDFER